MNITCLDIFKNNNNQYISELNDNIDNKFIDIINEEVIEDDINSIINKLKCEII